MSSSEDHSDRAASASVAMAEPQEHVITARRSRDGFLTFDVRISHIIEQVNHYKQQGCTEAVSDGVGEGVSPQEREHLTLFVWAALCCSKIFCCRFGCDQVSLVVSGSNS